MPPLRRALVVLLLASAAAAAPPGPGQPAQRLAAQDAAGRALQIPAAGRVTLLSFASPGNGEAAGRIARAIRVAHPEIEILSFIDLSSYPRLARGFVTREIRRRQRGAVEDTREAFARAGKVAPADLAERVHVIPDFERSAFASYGVGDAGNRPVMLLVGADGLVKARFEGPSRDAVEAAVTSLLGE